MNFREYHPFGGPEHRGYPDKRTLTASREFRSAFRMRRPSPCAGKALGSRRIFSTPSAGCSEAMWSRWSLWSGGVDARGGASPPSVRTPFPEAGGGGTPPTDVARVGTMRYRDEVRAPEGLEGREGIDNIKDIDDITLLLRLWEKFMVWVGLSGGCY